MQPYSKLYRKPLTNRLEVSIVNSMWLLTKLSVENSYTEKSGYEI